MKKLAEKLRKVDIELPKWTRNLLFEHLMEFCENYKDHYDCFKNKPVKTSV